MVWDVLNVIGTIAFAMSGALVAMEEKYDIVGIYILGFITSFGGGAIRNLFIGIPITELWQQTTLFTIAIITVTVIFVLPRHIMGHLRKWHILDAVGLSAFAIQGAMHALAIELPLVAIMFAAAITGAGGGILRDVLAQRKPFVLKQDIYVLWAVLAGFVIGMGWATAPYQLYLLFGFIVCLRLVSVKHQWALPTRAV
ncbi:trimeric intracellular cation channel family protein [Caldalkalibacillus salinus]|uniref:trimeric intracellular cation channel family protein n=1 Tax=Caldalkalibacillus salinus TaxID=2803787 RepID=UPI001920982F|nr:trimeric intracellular cation channel family protein [Caldalkalibacillus salinus]